MKTPAVYVILTKRCRPSCRFRKGNAAVPAELKDTIKAAIENYIKANNAPMEMLEKRFMKMAKTDEEKEFVKQMMDEVKNEE